jgi:hypothetical protein
MPQKHTLRNDRLSDRRYTPAGFACRLHKTIQRLVSASHRGQRYMASRSVVLSSAPLSEIRGIATRQLGHVTTPTGLLTSTRIPLWRLASGARCIVVLPAAGTTSGRSSWFLGPRATSPKLDRESDSRWRFLAYRLLDHRGTKPALRGLQSMGQFNFEPIIVNSSAPGGACVLRTYDDIGAFIQSNVEIPRLLSQHWQAVRQDLIQAASELDKRKSTRLPATRSWLRDGSWSRSGTGSRRRVFLNRSGTNSTRGESILNRLAGVFPIPPQRARGPGSERPQLVAYRWGRFCRFMLAGFVFL